LPLDYSLVRWPASAEQEAETRGFRVIVPVRPGYGKSDPLPAAINYQDGCVDDWKTLLSHEGVTHCPVISLGDDAHRAFLFAAAAPETVTAIIACGGVLPLTRREQYERMAKWHRFILAGARYTPHLVPFMVKAGFMLARKIGKRGFLHAVYGQSSADVATFEDPEVFEAMVTGSETALSETHSAHESFSRIVIDQQRDDWSSVPADLAGKLPVHFINGAHDPEVPMATLAEFQVDYPWIDYRVYEDAGQLVFFRHWRDVLELVETYLP
ncbi:MAG: alpha/beta hydrolase, partial [Pseudomonadota bacterium]